MHRPSTLPSLCGLRFFLFAFQFHARSSQAADIVYCKTDTSLHDPVVHMKGSLLHVYSINYPHRISVETDNECRLVIQAHKTYVNVIFVEGSIAGYLNASSLSNQADPIWLKVPATSSDDIVRFIGADTIVIHAIIDFANWVEEYKYSHFWNAFHLIIRAYNTIPNCLLEKEAPVLSLHHGHVQTADLWDVAREVSCEWKIFTASSNLSIRLDAHLETMNEEGPPQFRLMLFHGENLLHNLSAQYKWDRFYIENRDMNEEPLRFEFESWNFTGARIFLRLIAYYAPEDSNSTTKISQHNIPFFGSLRICDYELIKGGGEILTPAMGPQFHQPFAPISGDVMNTYLPNQARAVHFSTSGEQNCRWELLVPPQHQMVVAFYSVNVEHNKYFPNDGDVYSLFVDDILEDEHTKAVYTASQNLTLIFTTNRAEGSGGSVFILEMMLCDCYSNNPPVLTLHANDWETIAAPGNSDILTSDVDAWKQTCRPIECRWTRFGYLFMSGVFFVGNWGRIEIYENDLSTLNYTGELAYGGYGRFNNLTIVFIGFNLGDVKDNYYATFRLTPQIIDIAMNESFVVAASAWQPGIAFRFNAPNRTYLNVLYVMLNNVSQFNHGYNGTDFIVLDANYEIQDLVTDTFLLNCFFWDCAVPDSIRYYSGLTILRNPSSSKQFTFDQLFLFESKDKTVEFINEAIIYIDYSKYISFVRGAIYRLAARSPTKRPRLGFYSPVKEDLLFGGNPRFIINAFGDDNVSTLIFGRKDFEERQYFPLPWHIIRFVFEGAAPTINLIFTLESGLQKTLVKIPTVDTDIHDLPFYEWTLNAISKALLQINATLTFLPFVSKKHTILKIHRMTLSKDGSLDIKYDGIRFPLTEHMVGQLLEFPSGGRFELCPRGLVATDDFRIGIDASVPTT